MARHEPRLKAGFTRARSVHPWGMNTQLPTVSAEGARQAAYRRLAIVMLRLDVATLAEELRSARLDPIDLYESIRLPAAA